MGNATLCDPQAEPTVGWAINGGSFGLVQANLLTPVWKPETALYYAAQLGTALQPPAARCTFWVLIRGMFIFHCKWLDAISELKVDRLLPSKSNARSTELRAAQ